MAILEKGGNAFDAAVAMGFALQVVEPHLNGPGGEVPIIFHEAASGETKVLCGQGTAPAGATLEHYRGEGLDLVPGTGLLATVIPGAFDAWLTLLRDKGTMTLAEVMSHALDYAERGYPLVPLICQTIDRVAEVFEEDWSGSAALYLQGGRAPKPGSLFRNPQLAKTYRRIIAEGEAAGGDRVSQIEAARRAWSQGFVAETIDRFCRETPTLDSSGERHRGVLTGADMAGWSAHYEEPASVDYHGYRLCKGGFWSQGPVFLQQLRILEGFDLASLDPLGPEFVHLIAEACKLAMADREAFYGDPDFVSVPQERLLSRAYAEERRKLIGERASLELRPGEIEGYDNSIVWGLDQEDDDFDAIGAGEPTVQTDGQTRGDTCHLDVIDRWGNMVGATPSGGWLQSSPVIPELGFSLNSRAQMFWLEEGKPATLAPGKRPRTTLSVNLLLREETPYMVFGTPGGDCQDQWSVGFLLRHIHHGLNLQEAIDAPMWQTDHFPSSFWPRSADLGSLKLEARFPKATQEALKKRGHRVTEVDGWSLGRLSAVAREGDLLKGAANPRFTQGYAIGR
jgi:gamma-glutamyltranspeptidase/glutathione hydrolase